MASPSNTTDWDRLKRMTDEEVVFTEDAPATSPKDWEEAIAHRGIDALRTGLAARQSKKFLAVLDQAPDVPADDEDRY